MRQLNDVQEFYSLQFSQLGNSFEHMQLPSGFCIVEGVTDTDYLKRVLKLKIQDHRWHVMSAMVGDGGIPKKARDLKQVLGDFDTSPYADRILVVMDKQHCAGVETKLIKQGLDKKRHFVVWNHNGIEHYYPNRIVQHVFSDDTLLAKELTINDDRIKHNGIEKTKRELCDIVIGDLSAEDDLDPELDAFVSRIGSHS